MPASAHATAHPEPERKQHQLFMVRPANPIEPHGPLADGYTLRPATRGDHDSYAALFRAVFPETNHRFDSLWESSLPCGFLVVTDQQDRVVASAAAAIFPRDDHPGGASLQWVMADPSHRCVGIGRAVVQQATLLLANSGQPYAYLSTDDWRLAAIAIYLSLGWMPLLYEDDMERRWAHVFNRLNQTFTAAEWPTAASAIL